jgi:hypothetical protein
MDQIDEDNNPVEEIRQKYSTAYQIILLLQYFGLLITKNRALCTSKCKKRDKHRLYVKTRTKNSKKPFFFFRCTSYGRQTALLKNSFFSMIRTPFQTVVTIIKYWCAQLTISKTRSLLKMDKKKANRTTIGKIYTRLRNITMRTKIFFMRTKNFFMRTKIFFMRTKIFFMRTKFMRT